MAKKIWWLIGVYFLTLCIYAVFSYSLTAPNLILSSSAPYWNFQVWMWKTFFNNRQLLTYVYSGLIVWLFGCYLLVVKALRASELSKKMVMGIVVLCAVPLVAANNALSYDVFNYIFNAKMVAVYQANPHVHVALDYAYDDWTRFMHNTHTSAPYGYGWTALSLIPYTLGMGKFTLTWLMFRVFGLVSLLLMARALLTFTNDKQRWWVLVVLINPLMVIEIITNSHNDLWMMVPAVLSLSLVSRQTAGWKHVLISLVLLAASISIKYASIVLIPLWLFFSWQRVGGWVPSFTKSLVELVNRHWALLASLAMFALLLTNRSQQFHPWYLTWVLVWVPYITVPAWQWSVVALSASSLLRYLPYLSNGQYTPEVLMQQKLITWLPWLIITAGLFIWRRKTTTITV